MYAPQTASDTFETLIYNIEQDWADSGGEPRIPFLGGRAASTVTTLRQICEIPALKALPLSEADLTLALVVIWSHYATRLDASIPGPLRSRAQEIREMGQTFAPVVQPGFSEGVPADWHAALGRAWRVWTAIAEGFPAKDKSWVEVCKTYEREAAFLFDDPAPTE